MTTENTIMGILVYHLQYQAQNIPVQKSIHGIERFIVFSVLSFIQLLRATYAIYKLYSLLVVVLHIRLHQRNKTFKAFGIPSELMQNYFCMTLEAVSK